MSFITVKSFIVNPLSLDSENYQNTGFTTLYMLSVNMRQIYIYLLTNSNLD